MEAIENVYSLFISTPLNIWRTNTKAMDYYYVPMPIKICTQQLHLRNYMGVAILHYKDLCDKLNEGAIDKYLRNSI